MLVCTSIRSEFKCIEIDFSNLDVKFMNRAPFWAAAPKGPLTYGTTWGRSGSPFYHPCPPARPPTPPDWPPRPSGWLPDLLVGLSGPPAGLSGPPAGLSDLSLASWPFSWPLRPSGRPLDPSHGLSDPQADPLAGFQTLRPSSWLLRPSIWLLRPSSWPLRPSGRPLNLPAGLSDPLAGLPDPQTRFLTSQIQITSLWYHKSSADDPFLGRNAQFWALLKPPQLYIDLRGAKHS